LTDTLLALVPVWGPALLAIATFLSCLALPVPASLVMVAGGAFAATGDLSLVGSGLAALVGAVLGDQAGFHIGRRGGSLLRRASTPGSRLARSVDRARAFNAKWGGMGVFLSRWLFSPLGPYVNLIGGATGQNWLAFTLAGVAGEVVWVAVYVGLGFLFADRVEEISALAGNVLGMMAAGVLAVLLGRRLRRVLREGEGRKPRRH
jgi:membrane-associated protein